MGTIVRRPRKGGGHAFLAQISISRDHKIVFRQAKTFDLERSAAKWIREREAELAKPGALAEAAAGSGARGSTLGDAIDRYSADTLRAPGRTKTQTLRAIKAHDLGSMRCSAIGSRDIVAFAQALREKVQPQTVGNYLSHLASVFAIARPAWGYDLDQQAMADALKVAKGLGLTSKSRERSRRPTIDELDRLMGHFAEVRIRRPGSNPMGAIIGFAVFSTRRLEEITRIQWADLDAEGSRVLVRDMKNPGEKIGNDVWCDLPPEALRVIGTMPRRRDGAIFPFKPDAISTSFTRACKLLEISDLHFHDLRHDGVSRLFELGKTIPQVAAVSGHRSWQSLKRYTHLRQTGDKYEGWPWLEQLPLAVDERRRAWPTLVVRARGN